MGRLLRTLSIAMLCGILAVPAVEGRGRNDNRGAQTQLGTGNHRQAQGNHGSRNQAQRPGNNAQRPGNNAQRPNHNSNRPGNTAQGPGNNGMRPGNNGMGPGNNGFGPGNNGIGNRPGGNNGNGIGPGNNGMNPGHGPNGNPGFENSPKPGYGPNFGWNNIHFGAPYRPLMPVARPYTPPRRPVYLPVGGPSFGTILGIALGSAINFTINSLINNGYTVTGYGNNTVYVSDAMQLNLLWPNATLYYSNGGLVGSEFVYSTPYYDMMRYNTAYSMLYGSYGAPYSTGALPGGGLTATWWSNTGQYVQLQFAPSTAANGSTRYYTTLSFGN